MFLFFNKQCPNETEIEYFRAAISRGDITWHAGPMNMQPENMNEILFQMSLNISFELDKKFNIQRSFPTLSQRDVPGQCAYFFCSMSLIYKYEYSYVT